MKSKTTYKRVNRGVSDEPEAYTKLMKDGIGAGLPVEHLDWTYAWFKKHYYLDGRFRSTFMEKERVRYALPKVLKASKKK